MTTPEVEEELAPEHGEIATSPFQVLGSDDAGYCVDGVCVIPE